MATPSIAVPIGCALTSAPRAAAGHRIAASRRSASVGRKAFAVSLPGPRRSATAVQCSARGSGSGERDETSAGKNLARFLAAGVISGSLILPSLMAPLSASAGIEDLMGAPAEEKPKVESGKGEYEQMMKLIEERNKASGTSGFTLPSSTVEAPKKEKAPEAPSLKDATAEGEELSAAEKVAKRRELAATRRILQLAAEKEYQESMKAKPAADKPAVEDKAAADKEKAAADKAAADKAAADKEKAAADADKAAAEKEKAAADKAAAEKEKAVADKAAADKAAAEKEKAAADKAAADKAAAEKEKAAADKAAADKAAADKAAADKAAADKAAADKAAVTTSPVAVEKSDSAGEGERAAVDKAAADKAAADKAAADKAAADKAAAEKAAAEKAAADKAPADKANKREADTVSKAEAGLVVVEAASALYIAFILVQALYRAVSTAVRAAPALLVLGIVTFILASLFEGGILQLPF